MLGTKLLNWVSLNIYQLMKMTIVRTNNTLDVNKCQSWPVAVSSHSSESSCFSVTSTLFRLAILRMMTLASSNLPRLISHRGDSGSSLVKNSIKHIVKGLDVHDLFKTTLIFRGRIALFKDAYRKLTRTFNSIP